MEGVRVYNVSWKEIFRRAQVIFKTHSDKKFYGVPRGGQIVAGIINKAVDKPEDADIIIDDLIDSGTTKQRWEALYPNKPFVALFDKKNEPALKDVWLKFPWEGTHSSDIRDHVIRLLQQHNVQPTDDRIEVIQSTVYRLVQSWKAGE